MGDRPALRVDELLQSALRQAQRSDFTDRSFVHSLERLIESCNEEADLSTIGARVLRFDILRCLKNLLRFDSLEAACPSVLTRPIPAPVFITGMPRSGTTFLHRLILQDPRTTAPRLFQLVYPCATRVFGAALRKSLVRIQLSLFRLITPELHALHPIAVNAPEECTDITAHVFQSQRFESTYRVPSYRSWLRSYGLLNAYRFHRRFLQHLDAQLPGRQWILKSPDHVFGLDEIKSVYPDARVVFVHRDPVRVLASVTKLTEVLRRPFARSVDRKEVGAEVCASWLDGAERMRGAASASDSILHLHYRQIVSSPLDAVRAVYQHCGLALTAEAQRRMTSWLCRSARPRGPRRQYDLAEFGLDARFLRERFARYIAAFGVEMEDMVPGAGPAS